MFESGSSGRVRRFAGGVCFVVLCLAYAVHFSTLRMDLPMWGPATFEKAVAGTALTPFQYRVLVPWSVGVLHDHCGFSGLDLEQFRFGSELIFTFLLLVTFRAYIFGITRHRAFSRLSPLLLVWILPFHYLIPKELGLYYVYDIPSIFFFTLGLLLLYRKKWLLFYPVFLLATFNRETTCFLTLVYLFTAWPAAWHGVGDDRRSNDRTPQAAYLSRFLPLALHCFAQLAIWSAVKYLLHDIYGGSLHYTHYTRNFYLLRVPATYPILLSVFGFAWIPAVLGLSRIRDDFVRRACYVVPIFFLGMFIVAQMYEVRLYGEMIPIVLAAALLSLPEREVLTTMSRERVMSP